MNKSEFIGYLVALEDMVETEDEVELLQKIISRARSLDEVTTVPYTYPPTWPGTWIGQEIIKPTTATYTNMKNPLAEPDSWEVKCEKAPNFTVVK